MYARFEIRFGLRVAVISLAAAAALAGCRKTTTNTSPKPGTTTPVATPTTHNAAPSKFSPDVQKALGEIERAFDGVTSFSAKLKTHLNSAIGRTGWTRGKGTYDLMKDGKAVKINFKLINAISVTLEPDKKGSDELHTAELLNWVSDGSVLYKYTLQHELKQVRKTWYSPDDVLQLAGPPLIRELRSKASVKRLPDEVVDDKPAFVFEAKPHDGTWTEKHVIQKATGIRVQYIETDAKGQETYSLKVTSIDTGVTFEPDHFTFEVPKDTKLIDETR